jgi:hypothetical protein
MRPTRSRLGATSALLVGLMVAAPGWAQDPDKKTGEPEDLNDLSMEVAALQTLYQLKLDDDQLKKLRELAKGAGQKPSKRTPGTASKEYREKLSELRKALLDDADEQIDQLGEELDDLREAEKPAIDDGVDVTAAARKAAPAAVKLLRVRQLHDYLTVLEDDLNDPQAALVAALEAVREFTGKAWKEKRDELVENIVRLAAGVDAARAEKLTDMVTALLSTAHGLTEDEFKAQRPRLEETARQTIPSMDAFQVMRNSVEYSLAELLSNPRLIAVLEVRLKKRD